MPNTTIDLETAARQALSAIDQYLIDTPSKEWRDDLANAYEALCKALATRP